jgi:hypothetical protein
MRIAVPMTVLATALASSLATAPAHARARVFVASYGNDANPCTFGSPCKTFQQAVNVVDAGGEVTAIDSAGFGPINITKAVTITSPDGVEAGIVPVSGGDAIDINAGASDVINLHGLTLVGGGIGKWGILFINGGVLNIQNCVIRGFTEDGILFEPTASSKIAISDTIISNNGLSGIEFEPSGSGVSYWGFFERVQAIDNGGNGFDIVGGGAGGTSFTRVTAADSAASGNGGGFRSYGISGLQPTILTVVNAKAVGNVTAGVISVGPNGYLVLAQSTVSGNGQYGYEITDTGTIYTFSNNFIFDPSSGSLSTFPSK